MWIISNKCPPENIVDYFTKANAQNFSQVISFITGNKLSAFKTQEHHFSLIKEGYVGTLSSVDNPTFDQFKKHLLTQHKIQGKQTSKYFQNNKVQELLALIQELQFSTIL